MAVAACATSALWSVFQCTGRLFQHPIPSPVEITKVANTYITFEERTLPSKGLTGAQMAHVIRSVYLEPFKVRVADKYILKSTLYAYLCAGIPLIMIIDLYDISSKSHRLMGKHGVAITGYSLGTKEKQPYGKTGFLLRASRIDKIYVHDDQVGPFARMSFDDVKVSQKVSKEENIELESLSTSWRNDNGKIGSVRAVYVDNHILVPIYHKIRIPFEAVHDVVVHFDSIIHRFSHPPKKT